MPSPPDHTRRHRYQEIAAALRGRIDSAAFPDGRLPSERSLQAEFGVQRDTVRRALDLLEVEGVVFRDPARGTFVVPRGEPDAAGRAGSILLAVRKTENSTGAASILRGLTRVMDVAGRPIFWHDTLDKEGRFDGQVPSPEYLRARGVVGAALWPELPVPADRLRRLRAEMPLVLLDRRVPGFESDCVGFDDVAGGKVVTEHLLSLGHRRIGFLSAEPMAETVRARIAGYQAALAGAGIPQNPGRVLHGEGGLRSIPPAALADYLGGATGGDGPLTAVVCANDTLAVRLIEVLRAAGTRVPEGVAVTGFGNALPPLLDALGLTTIEQPYEQVGRAAGEILLERIRERSQGGNSNAAPVREVTLPVRLVVRRSCGATAG